MATTVIDQDLYRLLALGLPRLTDRGTLDFVRAAEGHRPPYELLASPEMRPILAAALESCADTLASAVDPDLRAAYANLYRRPELTDLVWLNEFRIVSARMARHKHVVVFLVFIPLDPELVTSLCERLDRTARDVGLDHAYGFLTPIDLGRRAVLEYDYYIDHPDPLEKQRMSRAMAELVPWLDALCQGPSSNMTWLKTVLMQGSARKESWLYRDLSARGSC
jgi:hypothetical protein